MHSRTAPDPRKIHPFRIQAFLTVQLVVALAFYSVAVHAADIEPGKPRAKSGFQAAKPTTNLKFDMTLPSAALIAAAEDCDEGDLVVQAMAARIMEGGASRQDSFATSKPLAKLAMADQLTTAYPTSTDTKDASAKPSDQPGETASTAVAEFKPLPATTIAVTPKPSRTWEITPADKTLRSALGRWATSAGWQLVWELPVDYSVEALTTVPGTFEEAVGLVAKGMDSAEIPMKAILYSGNKVLRIVTKGNE
jgi:hypothetical protein